MTYRAGFSQCKGFLCSIRDILGAGALSDGVEMTHSEVEVVSNLERSRDFGEAPPMQGIRDVAGGLSYQFCRMIQTLKDIMFGAGFVAKNCDWVEPFGSGLPLVGLLHRMSRRKDSAWLGTVQQSLEDLD